MPHFSCVQKAGRSESLERSGLSRAHSLRIHGFGGAVEEGLKRVSSAPQLGDPDKGALLKRKLSGSETGPGVAYSHSTKYKKQLGKLCRLTTKQCQHQDITLGMQMPCKYCVKTHWWFLSDPKPNYTGLSLAFPYVKSIGN